MAELSLFWAGDSIGDAAVVTDDVFSDFLADFMTYDRTTQGVLDTGRAGFTGGMIVTGAAGSVNVATGIAMVDGKPYKSSAVENVPIPTPAVSTRIDRIVLRKTWPTQLVRITRIAGVEGGAAPAIVQIDGTTWDIKLAQVVITTGVVITVTNEAQAIRNPGGPGYQYASLFNDDNAFTAAAYNSIGAGFTLTLGPGKWEVTGQLTVTSPAAGAGERRALLYNQTTSTPLAEGYATMAASEKTSIPFPPTIIDPTVITVIELQLYAATTTDSVKGDSLDAIARTTLMATRVI